MKTGMKQENRQKPVPRKMAALLKWLLMTVREYHAQIRSRYGKHGYQEDIRFQKKAGIFLYEERIL